MRVETWEPGVVAKALDSLTPLRFKVSGDPELWLDVAGDVRYPSCNQLRPLLVLDPDDADQMHQIAGHFWGHDKGGHEETTRRITEAVRAMLPKPTPVRPPEPTGLGAVVEDDSHRRFVRVDDRKRPWVTQSLGVANRLSWDEVAENPVKVLSEGVTP